MNPQEYSWITTFLTALGLPTTTQNINFVQSWIAAEGPFGTQYNPLNAFDAASGNDTSSAYSIAQWMQTNGNFGGLGTYAQEVKNFLSGLPNNISSSLAWWSGHSGNAGDLSTSYQTAINSVSNPQGTGGGTTNAPQSSSGSGNAITNAIGSLFSPITNQFNQIQSTAIVLTIAIALFIVGGIWLASGDKETTENVTAIVKKSLPAATEAA